MLLSATGDDIILDDDDYDDDNDDDGGRGHQHQLQQQHQHHHHDIYINDVRFDEENMEHMNHLENV